jgi:alpha-mannosidase
MQRWKTFVIPVVAALCPLAPTSGQDKVPPPDLTKQPTLYMVGYAHLDTQWRWCYPQVIREMLPKTMHDNFRFFELYPDYVFNFSGANRYRMMKEYYPADYEKVKQYGAAGRWFPCGSSMEECDVNVPSAESIIRQVLYGNHFFRQELGQASAEFMLPDCFGFPASLPSLLGHCGLKGFSTQKLSWGSAVGIPFHVGVWQGLDGTGLLAALDAGDYTGQIKADLSADEKWLQRIDENGQKSGVYCDYQYYGTGDEGGAPTEDSVKWLEKSVAGSGPVRVMSSTAERMFLDIPAQNVSKLPRYQGDLLLTEHSAGSITSAAYMKRWNRKNELLADAAERASVLAAWVGGPAYPRERLNNAWTLVMGGQFHDILPGTSHPKAYEYSWNDEILALNQFASVLDSAVGAIAAGLNTQAQGVPLVVYNPLSIQRQDVVEASVTFPGTPPNAVRVLAPDGKEGLSQIVGTDQGALKILFLATVPSVGFAVFDVQPAEAASVSSTDLAISESSLENARYRVTLDANGDIAGIFDKEANRELLSAPARLAFLHDKPRAWPAWNIDWADQQKPPEAYVEGPAQVRIVERGPVRVALEVTREGRDSRFVQTIRLAARDAGSRIEVASTIDWQSRVCSLKAVFSLTVANPKATYNWEVGTISRGNNDPKKYEVPTHQWLDLTDTKGDYGVTVLSDCKYGSDKPDDQTLRLTLLRTPGTGGEYQDQGTQDWGRHEILYGLAGHAGDWRKGQTDWQALRLQQPPIAFQATAHDGQLGRTFSLLNVNSSRVRVMAVKKTEDSNDEIIVRLVELDGLPASGVHVTLPAPIAAAREVNGQEQPVGEAKLSRGELVTDFSGYRLRSFALKLGQPPPSLPAPAFRPVQLTYDRCVTSRDEQKATGGFDADGRCLPAEMLPADLAYRGVTFNLGPVTDGQPNAVTCRGQALALPAGQYNRLYLLAAATGEHQATFLVDAQPFELNIQDWGGYIGQWDNRIWKGPVEERAFAWPNELLGLQPAYIRPAPVAWFCSHRHTADGQNELYAYCYLFAYALDLPAGAKSLTLPKNEQVFLLAATAANDPAAGTRPAQPLLDELKRDGTPLPKISPPGGTFTDSTAVTLARPLFGGESALRYTLNGSDPQPDSPEFETPLLLSKDTVVKARLLDPSGGAGPVVEARFQINDRTPPRVLDAVGFPWSPEVYVRFSEPLDRASAESAANYQIPGSHVKTATLAPDSRGVTLTLSASPADAQPVLTIQGVRDRSPNGNALAGVRQNVSLLHPITQLTDKSLDGSGGGFTEQPLGTDAPVAAAAPWTINVWLSLDQQPGDFTLIAGVGSGRGGMGTQRYLAKFPHGLHFWGSNVDVKADMALDLGKWQMLTATFDGSVLKLFKDGRELATQEISLADAAPIAKLGPPAPWPYGHRLAGKIAEFTLWPQALPPASVAALHQLGPQTAIR